MNLLTQIREKIELILGAFIGAIWGIIKLIVKQITWAGFIAVIALLIFFFWGLIIEKINHTRAYSLIAQGDNAYKNDKYVEAIKKYEHALELFPEHVKARYNLGNIYVAYEDYEQAAKNYEEALEVKPGFLKARINLGIVLTQELRQIDKAIEHYQKAVDTKPFILGFLYNNKAEVKADKAVAYYNLGLAYKDKSLLLGGDSIKAREQLEKATKAYFKSLDLRPNDYETIYNLALTYQLLGNYNESKKYYCKAINLKPLNYESHYNFGILLKVRGKYFYSIEEFEKAGLILNSRGDSYNSRYIYDVLNEVNQRAIIKEGLRAFVKKQEESKLIFNPTEIKYVNGKVVISDRLDRSIWENLKTCGACKGE